MGLSGLEPPTSRLSGVRSNQLSYKPEIYIKHEQYDSRKKRGPQVLFQHMAKDKTKEMLAFFSTLC